MIATTRPVDLAPFNTLRLPGCAAAYLRLDSCTVLGKLPAHQHRFILGGGSNLVVTGDFDGLVLHVALSGKRLLHADDDAWYIEAAAGENWHDFVLWTLAQGWPGLENLALIPGQVGAAPIQNIGAYGMEVGEYIFEVHAYDFKLGRKVSFAASDCLFGYRNSLFKQQGWHRNGALLIISVVFRLPKHWQPRLEYAELERELAAGGIERATPQQIADTVIAIRQRKLPDPEILPNAGSFFENPRLDASVLQALLVRHPDLPYYPQADGSFKIAAGWLIEKAGWKGRNLGPTGMYARQALVLVNHGGALGADILRLVAAVQADVERLLGIRLQPEPVFLGVKKKKSLGACQVMCARSSPFDVRSSMSINGQARCAKPTGLSFLLSSASVVSSCAAVSPPSASTTSFPGNDLRKRTAAASISSRRKTPCAVHPLPSSINRSCAASANMTISPLSLEVNLTSICNLLAGGPNSG